MVMVVMMVWLHRQQPEGEKTWPGLKREALRGWWMYIKVSVDLRIQQE